MCNINYSYKLIFETDKNRYALAAQIKEHEIFEMVVKVYDKKLVQKILTTEQIKRIYTKNESESFRLNKYEIEDCHAFILLKVKII